LRSLALISHRALSLAPADSAARVTESYVKREKTGEDRRVPHTRPFEDQERSERSDRDVQDDDDDDDDADERTSLSAEDKIEGPDRRPSLVRARTSCGSGRSYNYSFASCELTRRAPILYRFRYIADIDGATRDGVGSDL